MYTANYMQEGGDREVERFRQQQYNQKLYGGVNNNANRQNNPPSVSTASSNPKNQGNVRGTNVVAEKVPPALGS
jgi:hypothetical protein